MQRSQNTLTSLSADDLSVTSADYDDHTTGEQNLVTWYRMLVKAGHIEADERQREAVDQLQHLADWLLGGGATATNGGWIKNWRWLWRDDRATDKAPMKQGIYLHGGAGRGKSFLMDGFYVQLPLQKKQRVHFHQFMRDIHADMKKREQEHDPLSHIVDDLANRFNLICFDEFHVSDIADAMLLGRLLEKLLAANTCFVMTSNYPPSELYPNGLARDRFLPTITLLNTHLQTFSLDGGDDYRRAHLCQQSTYLFPCHEATHLAMTTAFHRLACGLVFQQDIRLSGRLVAVVARSSDCIWFDFDSLCQSARGKEDYLQLAEQFNVVFLSAVPPLNYPDCYEASRRFTWLIDILYDQRIQLVIAAEVAIEALYGNGEGGESGRTLSRLYEMQSAAYRNEKRRRYPS